MNENARAWVEALRGGEFTQTNNWLKDETGHCCLGVACELHRRATGRGEWFDPGLAYGASRYRVLDENGTARESAASTLPDAVRDWLGLNDADGTMCSSDSLVAGVLRRAIARGEDDGPVFDDVSLIDLNDTYRADFHTIARVLEAEPEGLFR